MNKLVESYDVAVIGAGHAGCEAALAAARLGMETIIFTVSVDSIALMPCNPNIGGSSKGHLVKEIDALGGEMIKRCTAIRCGKYWKIQNALPSGRQRLRSLS